MMTALQAAILLQAYEDFAKREEDGTFSKRFGNSFFCVDSKAPPEKRYQWGINYVEKACALNVVRTFAQSPQR